MNSKTGLIARFNIENGEVNLHHNFRDHYNHHPLSNIELKNTKILEVMMTKQISLDALWDSATSQDRVFHSDDFTHLPETARRYLEHAIAPLLL